MSEMMALAAEASGPRPRKAPRAIRRRQILEATVESINKHGFADTTLATVAKLAGISQASLIFHFKTKDALLIETLRHLSDEYRETWHAALAAAPEDPITRICILVATDFAPQLCNRKKVAVWAAFWGEAKTRPTYMQICGARDEERSAAMAKECAGALKAMALPVEQAQDRAAVIESLNDGLWQRLLMEPKSFTRYDGLRLMFLQLCVLFPQAAEEIEAQADALWRSKWRSRKSVAENRLEDG